MNTKFVAIVLILIASVAGLFVAMSLSEGGGHTEENEPYTSDNPQYVAVRKEIESMKEKPWDAPVYHRIKNTIKSYVEGGQMEDKMSSELERLLTSKYLLLLAAAIDKHCTEQADISSPTWQTLQAEMDAFASNPDLKEARRCLSDYQRVLAAAYKASKYAKEEAYDQAASERFSEILENLPAKFKANSKLNKTVDEALSALGTQSGYNRRFANYENGEDGGFAVCDCRERFKENKYYQQACLDKQ